MARNRESKIELTAYDDLFETDESRAEANLSKIRAVSYTHLDVYKRQTVMLLSLMSFHLMSFILRVIQGEESVINAVMRFLQVTLFLNYQWEERIFRAEIWEKCLSHFRKLQNWKEIMIFIPGIMKPVLLHMREKIIHI